MATFIYWSFVEDAIKSINVDTATFYAMVVTSSYTPSQAHTRRSNVSAYEVSSSGTGYPAGGIEMNLSVSRSSNAIIVAVPTVEIPAPVTSIVGRYAVVYHHRGGADSADELVMLIDKGVAVAANGTGYFIGTEGPITFTVP
jgi:hypothetical protein